jgi:hypothetical protein
VTQSEEHPESKKRGEKILEVKNAKVSTSIEEEEEEEEEEDLFVFNDTIEGRLCSLWPSDDHRL